MQKNTYTELEVLGSILIKNLSYLLIYIFEKGKNILVFLTFQIPRASELYYTTAFSFTD